MKSDEVLPIAPCGMNCRVCIAYLREKNRCPGCRGNDAGKPVTRLRCKIKTCDFLKESGADFCGDCGKFPCASLKKLDSRYRSKYHMSMVENLENIHKIGIGNFLRNENIRWACSACGGTVCVHMHGCYSCGQDWRSKQGNAHSDPKSG